MRLVQLTEDFSSRNAGVTSALCGLTGYLGARGVPVRVVAAGDDSVPALPGVAIDCCRLVRWGAAWRFSPVLQQHLGHAISESCILHIHGVWMHPQWVGMRLALGRGIPYVLTPHNMLGGWLWRRGGLRRIKKRLYWELMIKKHARRACVVHALSSHERDILWREFSPTCRVEVIPNAVHVTQIDDLLRPLESEALPERRYLLFLGRLHPVKGLERLLDALLQNGIGEPLIVAGPPHSDRYLAQLKARARQLGLSRRVQFLGPVQGIEKWRLIRNALALCSPSFSEGMSMVTLEAMAAKTPVIASRQTAVSGWQQGGGLVFEHDGIDLGRALKQAISWSVSERQARGAAARGVVQKTYDWSVVGPQYLELYRDLMP